ncbi:hypothetical protein [Xenorhabdus bovienii]|uniref:hypothetical protein n=1 Tax=Xenorhabdus bovienii TaxID=40576 RepID=UPI00237CAB88|nr:hypothetical protein [Xenorhabdus bovienii]MDE1474904.1 hypothetical protein [Xenorhabdus bovienii]MDE1483546.1 hypothetical protein [Xenorhabdus bovienii]MDE9428979.1 hypothetical protein [Xenorhabdus bovienii]MDE9434387.1 hypothetical protein [Xenorhabdus bovienii]MDE9442422.1 hypothetical protein [Xenorhabdus bovienii]
MNDSKNTSPTITTSNSTILEEVNITRLETSPANGANNNALITIRDKYGIFYSNFYLAYPSNSVMESAGLYITLLIALTNSIKVSIKTTAPISNTGSNYITGVIISDAY